MNESIYTTTTAFLEALNEQRVEFIFANLGSDHPALVECLAEAKQSGRLVPRMITCPNEMVALSMAHGHAQVSGRAQAVVVHVECGTQALAGAIHNAAKGRIPVLIFAGSSPYTQEQELTGSRNEFIQWIQDVHDQRGLVRGYMRYDNEIRTGANVKQLVHRAMQFAHSDPKGPVYLMGPREVMEAQTVRVETDIDRWQPLRSAALPDNDARFLLQKLTSARRPLVVTSYFGRNPASVPLLAQLCRRIGIGVLESVPNYMNFPHDDPHYRGGQWNQACQNRALGEADMVLVIDSDVPWISKVSRPSANCEIYHVDSDPLKEQMPLWYICAHRSWRADSGAVVSQLLQLLDENPEVKSAAEKSAHHRAAHDERRKRLLALETGAGSLTVPYLMARLRQAINPTAIILNEGITNYQVVFDHLAMTRPGSIFTSGGGSLGWNGGAALGMKLAAPDSEVVAITGDGSYMFSVPSSVHWIARRYAVPFLQIVLNNGGWNAPRHSALAVHPSGFASREPDLGLSFEPAPDYGGIAHAAGGAQALRIENEDDADAVIAEALQTLRNERRSVVIDALVPAS